MVLTWTFKLIWFCLPFLTHKDPVQLRSLCLTVTPEASYRIQYDSLKARIFFSYLPEGETLLTVPQEEDAIEEDDEHVDDNETMQEAEDKHGRGDSKLTAQKRAGDGEKTGSDPPSKRPKLKYY